MATPIQTMPGFMVYDGFTFDPIAVRNSALRSGFGNWVPNKGEFGPPNFTGMSFWGNHSIMCKNLSIICGQPIYPNAMFFRVTNEDTLKAYIHSDREDGEYTAIVYLSEHDDKHGTGFYKHRELNSVLMADHATLSKFPEKYEELKKDMMEASPAKWELVQFVEGKLNRALIFDARLYHSRHPDHGYGTTSADGRMIWGCHFNL